MSASRPDAPSPAPRPEGSPDPPDPRSAPSPPDPEADERPGAPDQGPVPEHGELLEAMTWAFEGDTVAAPLLERYARHARLLLEGNRELNLTAIVDPREVAAKHYLDCWRVTRLMPLMGRTILDLGSGGGFPGMPIAMAEDQTKVVLCESRQRRAAFLERCVEAMGLANASVTSERGEDHLARNHYDVVFVRAISSIRENVRLLRKVRHRFQDLVLFKGPSWSREVRAAEREVERLGFRLDTVFEHTLPGDMGQRALLVYRAPGSN